MVDLEQMGSDTGFGAELLRGLVDRIPDLDCQSCLGTRPVTRCAPEATQSVYTVTVECPGCGAQAVRLGETRNEAVGDARRAWALWDVEYPEDPS